MTVGKRFVRLAALVAALTGGLLVSPARPLEPVFSQDSSAATRDVKVCILLLAATYWENPEPFFLPSLASNDFQTIRNLRPSNWNLVNPLASTVVTPAIAQLWNWQTSGAVVFDGVSAVVQNDYDAGTSTLAEDQALYMSAPAGIYTNPGGPNTYHAHSQPSHLAQYGVGGAGSAKVPPLPAVGLPLPKTHPAYWEVPLTPQTVSQLADFDAVFVNTHRNLRFSAQEQTLLKQFLDQGGTLWLEDSHGCRMEVKGGSDPKDPSNVDFFLPFQFCDGLWGARLADGTRSIDGYPINTGGIGTLTPSKTVQSPGNPLLNGVQQISAAEADMLGDVRAKDHLIVRSTPSIYLMEEILRTTANDNPWANQTGTREPALAVAHIGSGKLVLSALDCIDDCSKPYETGTEPAADWIPDLKVMYNLLAWKSGEGGNRRGGANNQGVVASSAPRSFVPRFVWNWPKGGPDASNNYQFQLTTGDIETYAAPDPTITTDPNYTLKDPLCSANGVVYLQYQYSGDYYLVAVDANRDTDLDGDGSADDGVPDVNTAGATSDTIWFRNMGTKPVSGACVVAITSAATSRPIDVLLASQVNNNGDGFLVWALYASLDAANTPVQEPNPGADRPGGAFSNWGGNNPFDSTVAVGAMVGVDDKFLSAPVAYDDKVYVTCGTNWGIGNKLAEWVRVVAVRMVDDPTVAGNQAGLLSWCYPQTGVETPSGTTASQQDDALKQVDTIQNVKYGSSTPNWLDWFQVGGAGSLQFALNSVRLVPHLPESTNLLPVVGLATDSRTGLTSPTVFFNRANGDVWAVDQGLDVTELGWSNALGWKLDITDEFQIPAGNAPSCVTIGAGPGSDGAGAPLLNTAGNRVAYYVTLGGTALATFQITRDASETIQSVELLIDPATWRSQPYGTTATVTYTIGTRTVQQSLPLYPRHRLLRADRDSGYHGFGVVDMLGFNSGAPMLLDSDTLVSTCSSLWLASQQPDGKYEDGVTSAADGVGQGVSGNTAVAAYQVRASGPLTFFDNGADSRSVGNPDPNNYGPVRWVFDPGSVLPDKIQPIINLTAGGPSTPVPQDRPTFSLHGAPVKYGETVVVAGTWNAAQTNASSLTVLGGGVMAVAPNPVLSARVPFKLVRNAPAYLLTVDPTGAAVGSGANGKSLSAMPTDLTGNPLRAFVVDPAQFTLDYGGNVISLRADLAHLTKLAQPLPDAAAAAAAGLGVSGEPFPEAYRLPLYGRRLWLVQDTVDGAGNPVPDGKYEAGDTGDVVFIPSPIRWMYLPYTVVLDAPDWVDSTTIVVKRKGSAGALSLGSDYYLDDPERPYLLRIDATSANVAAGDTVSIQYTYRVTQPGVFPSGSATTTIYRVVPGNPGESPALPGFYYSPVVAGDKLYLSGTQLATFDPADSLRGGGIYSFEYGADGVVSAKRFLPDLIPGWSNFDDAKPVYDGVGSYGSFVRGIPLAVNDEVFVSFGLIGDSSGSVGQGQFVAPLFALGGSEMLVTESQRLARVDYDGRVLWQLTGTKEKNAAERPAELIANNPLPSDLLTSPLSRPSKALNLDGDGVLVVDTGNNRVFKADKTGSITWPLDSRINSPDGALRYQGLKDFGLQRPTDAGLFTIRNSQVHPWAQWDVNGDTFVNAADIVAKDGIVIADRGNHRLEVVISYQRPEPTTGVGQTYYEPIVPVTTAAPPPADPNARIGGAWQVTADKVFDAKAQRWIAIPFTGVMAWDPWPNDNDPFYDAGFIGAWPKDNQDFYFVAWAEGMDRIFNLHMDRGLTGEIAADPTRNNGICDDDNDGVIDGAVKNLSEMVDEWSRLAGVDGNYGTTDDGWASFRGLRYVKRFHRAQVPYLLVIQNNDQDNGAPMVVCYSYSYKYDNATGKFVLDTAPIAAPADGIVGSRLHRVWTFTRADYAAQLYGPATDPDAVSYYGRAGVLAAIRYDRWYANGAKQWNPTVARVMPFQNELAIVNSASNSVNQTASNSEVLIVHFDPVAPALKRVEHVLPDLSTTSTYPAGRAASRRRPDYGSYPVSSPVEVHQ